MQPKVELAKVEEVIEIMRPAIQADGGDISLIGIDDESGVVTVETVRGERVAYFLGDRRGASQVEDRVTGAQLEQTEEDQRRAQEDAPADRRQAGCGPHGADPARRRAT